jgi:hypothetical protein
MIDDKSIKITLTPEQRRTLLALLGRVPLKGAEAGAFLEIFNLIKKPPAGEGPHPRPALATIQQPIKP